MNRECLGYVVGGERGASKKTKRVVSTGDSFFFSVLNKRVTSRWTVKTTGIGVKDGSDRNRISVAGLSRSSYDMLIARSNLLTICAEYCTGCCERYVAVVENMGASYATVRPTLGYRSRKDPGD